MRHIWSTETPVNHRSPESGNQGFDDLAQETPRFRKEQ